MPNVFLDGLQRPAILPNNSGLPDYSEANDGDALIIEDGEPTWGAVDALPEIEETDEGKVLAVDQGEAVWADAPSGLPEIGENDEGKVLTVVDNSGTLEAEWAEPSGGTLPDLSGLEVPLGTAVMGAISAIPSGGLMGKYAGLQGSTITAEQAE